MNKEAWLSGDYDETIELFNKANPQGKLFNFLFGQTMKKSKNQADPKVVKRLLAWKLFGEDLMKELSNENSHHGR